MPSSTFPSLLVLLSAATAAAQTPPLADYERRLRDPELDALVRIELVDALLETGPRGAIVVARATAAAGKAMSRTMHAARREATRRFAQVAEQLIRDAARGKEREIDELRREVAALRANPSLSEQKILAVADPALSHLRALLTVSVHGAISVDDELATAVETLERQLDLCRDLDDAWSRALEVLTTDDEPDPRLARLEAPTDPDEVEREFRAELALRARLATPTSKGGSETLRENAALAAQLEPTEADGIFELNQLRLVLGLRPLRIDLKLCLAARDHSKDMETLGFFSHTSPVPGKRSPGDRAARAGTSGGAENIAQGHDDGPGAIRGWWYSPGHHRNMLGRHGRVGLGRSGTLWTLMFGG